MFADGLQSCGCTRQRGEANTARRRDSEQQLEGEADGGPPLG
jgi:hypothetical protein